MSDCFLHQDKKKTPQPPPSNVWRQPAVGSLERKGWGPIDDTLRLIQAPDTQHPHLVAAGGGKRREGGE